MERVGAREAVQGPLEVGDEALEVFVDKGVTNGARKVRKGGSARRIYAPWGRYRSDSGRIGRLVFLFLFIFVFGLSSSRRGTRARFGALEDSGGEVGEGVDLPDRTFGRYSVDVCPQLLRICRAV
jgi:hypothetical protein